jgi:hypothetical protein
MQSRAAYSGRDAPRQGWRSGCGLQPPHEPSMNGWLTHASEKVWKVVNLLSGRAD